MRCITSREHPFFKKLVKLQNSARQRCKEGLALLDGVHLLQACLTSGQTPETLIVSESGIRCPEISHLLDQIDENTGTNRLMLSDVLFSRVSPVKTPAGVLALIPIPQPDSAGEMNEHTSCIMLETIQDPGNLGSILRSAAAAGIREVFLSVDCTDSWSPKTLRAGMGAHFSLNIHEQVDLVHLAQCFAGQVIATTLSGADSIYHTDLRGSTAFVFGNEGSGLSEKILKVVNRRVMIPMSNHTESLNVAAAAAICLFEKVRQQIISV
jgi:TrmH family RNA methyltransferase